MTRDIVLAALFFLGLATNPAGANPLPIEERLRICIEVEHKWQWLAANAECDALIAEGLRTRGEVAAALVGYAEDETLARDFWRVHPAYRRSLRYDEKNAEAWLLDGNYLFGAFYSKDAFAAYERAISLDPTLAEAYEGRGKVYYYIFGDMESGLRDFDTALRLRPTPEVFRNRASLYWRRGDFDAALADYDRAAEIADSIAYHMIACDARSLAGRGLERASTHCDAVERVIGGLPRTMVSRGLILLHQGRYTEAVAQFDRAFIADEAGGRGLETTPHFYRGVALHRLGRHAEGDAEIAAANLSPTHIAHLAAFGIAP